MDYKTETRYDGNGQPYDVRLPIDSNIVSINDLQPKTPLNLADIPQPDITGLLGTTQGAIDYTKSIADRANLADVNLEKSKTDISKLMESLVGKTADIQSANESSGLNSATKQLNELNAQAQLLNREAQAIPLQTQQRNANTGATDVGVAPQTTEALRNNAIKALSIAQQTDIATANYIAAKDKAQQIIDIKYKPIEDLLAIKKQQYEFNKDTLEKIDKKRADALDIAIKKEERDLNDKKNLQDTYSKLAIDGGDSQLASKITTLDPQSPNFKQDLAGLQGQIKQKLNLDTIKVGDTTILIDKNTGKTIKTFGVEPSSTLQSVPEEIKGLASIGDLVGGFSSVNAQKMFTKNIKDLALKGDEKGLAEKIVGQTLANIPDAEMRKKATGGFLLSQQLTGLQKLLNDFEAKGGKTNILTGKTQDIQQKLGLLGDPDLANIGTQILNQLDNLARTRTGAVISPSEEKLYARLLPSIGKTGELNRATIEGLKTSLMGDVENNLRYNLTSDGLDMIKASLPEVFDYNDNFLNSFSSQNINKNLDNASFFKALPY